MHTHRLACLVCMLYICVGIEVLQAEKIRSNNRLGKKISEKVQICQDTYELRPYRIRKYEGGPTVSANRRRSPNFDFAWSA